MSMRVPLASKFGTLRSCGWLLAGLLATVVAGDEPKPFRLFVGVDLLVKSDAENYRRVDSIKSDQVVLAEEGLPRMKLREAGAFSWERSAKVSRAPISITEFEQHKVFTLRNDKAMQYMNTQNHMAIYQQEKADAARLARSDAQVRQGGARTARGYVEQAIKDGIDVMPDTVAAVEAANALADAEVLSATNEMSDQFFETDSITGDPTFLDRMQGAAAEGGEDALDLAFNLSSPVPIADAYAVIMGAVTQDDEKGIVTFHHPVGAIGPEPRKIKVRKTGFAPGFTITDVKIHLYVHGKELATNLSERAVDLTRKQAREYLLLSYLADHAVETMTPAPVWTLAPAALLAAESSAGFDYPVVVNIDADGSVISIHESETDARAYLAEIHDAADLRSKSTPAKSAQSMAASVRVTAEDAGISLDQTGRLPAPVVAAMRDMIFMPALDLGAPIAGTAKVNLADFFR